MQLLKVRTQQKPMLVPQLISRKDDEFKEDNKALNDQGEGEGTNSFCHSPTQPQLELVLDLIMGRNHIRGCGATI